MEYQRRAFLLEPDLIDGVDVANYLLLKHLSR